MKLWTIAPLLAGLLLPMLPLDAEAKRFGGGRSFGMQRQAPAKPATPPPAQNAQANQAAPAATPAAATAGAAPKRSWMGPVAGLAAGLGLAALASHLGFGEGLANFMMLALLAVGAVLLLRVLLRRFAGAGPRPAFAGAPGATARTASAPVRIGSSLAAPMALPEAGAASTGTTELPADFDRDGFERIAKMIFIRMQAANDSADLDDLRNFTTPELFAELRLELHERGAAAQRTDVEQIDAELLDFAQEDQRQVVSVRFKGLVREQAGAQAEPFDEVWHLVRPADGSRNWAIAGIQQNA